MEFVLDRSDNKVICEIPLSEWTDLVDGVIDAKALRSTECMAAFRCFDEDGLEVLDNLLFFLRTMLRGEFADAMPFFMRHAIVSGEYIYFDNTKIVEG